MSGEKMNLKSFLKGVGIVWGVIVMLLESVGALGLWYAIYYLLIAVLIVAACNQGEKGGGGNEA